jgi:hypothetical protein
LVRRIKRSEDEREREREVCVCMCIARVQDRDAIERSHAGLEGNPKPFELTYTLPAEVEGMKSITLVLESDAVYRLLQAYNFSLCYSK